MLPARARKYLMRKKKRLTPDTLCVPICAPIHDPETPGLLVEQLPSGRKRWLFRRRMPNTGIIVKLSLGYFPARSIADARAWATRLNAELDKGRDPRAGQRKKRRSTAMTVARAHNLYMVAVREGRSSRAKRTNKPRTIRDKLEIYERDIAPTLASKNIHLVREDDLVELVNKKGLTARVRANRLAAELAVFFGWAASLRGLEVGLKSDPTRRLADLRFPETKRSRKLSTHELEWFLLAVVDEEPLFRRGMLVWLLSAARIAEVSQARSDEIVGGVWTIPGERTKNSVEHRIALGPWGLALMASDDEWVFPARRVEGPRKSGWYKARDRVKQRMEALAGRQIARFTPHDFRRTARSNTKRLKVDFETAEAMLNHLKTGMERTYDTYELEEEKRAWFLKWETEIANIARRLGIARALEVPNDANPEPSPAALATAIIAEGGRHSRRLSATGLLPANDRDDVPSAAGTPRLTTVRATPAND